MGAKVDLTGQVFGRLTVLDRAANKGVKTAWVCRCTCGALKEILTTHLRSGLTTSCGCYNAEAIGERSRTHGLTKSPEYRVWAKMLERCANPSTKGYENYGGRGISVCEAWKDFSNFYADMGPRPEGYSIERVDNEKGYSPDNCIWADRYTQNANTRSVRNSRTGVVGVWAGQGKRFKAYIKVAGKAKYLGSSDTVEGASLIREAALENVRLLGVI